MALPQAGSHAKSITPHSILDILDTQVRRHTQALPPQMKIQAHLLCSKLVLISGRPGGPGTHAVSLRWGEQNSLWLLTFTAWFGAWGMKLQVYRMCLVKTYTHQRDASSGEQHLRTDVSLGSQHNQWTGLSWPPSMSPAMC